MAYDAQNPAVDFPILGYFDRQRFKQFNPSDTANWYMLDIPQGKKKIAMYPTMGRRHINFLGLNRLIFAEEPRGAFRSINFAYFVVADTIIKVDKLYNQVDISGGLVTTLSGDVFFDYIVAGDVTYAVFVDGQNVYIYNETTGAFDLSTDPNTPPNPKFIATFGNRIAVSSNNSSEFRLSAINLAGGALGTFNPALVFTIAGNSIFAQEAGIIRQMTVLHNTLYIFTDFSTGIWSNTPAVIPSFTGGSPTTFPWKKNTTYDWDFGIADPKSLDTDFGQMTWLAQNKNGLIQVMTSTGDKPSRISTRAIDTLFQRNIRQGIIGPTTPFLNGNADGFLYQWENTIFYRLSAGNFEDFGILDIQTEADSIEYNFDTGTWHRVIEKNGERNRIQKHIYFNNAHLVTVIGDNTVYEMGGQFYDNEISNPDQSDPQAEDAYLREPFRYERVTPIIAQDDYAEFITDWVEIDFVWGESFNVRTTSSSDGNFYNTTFKPHIELYFSNDGGVTFEPADVREFSQLGVYQWRMRWYQLGPSRNRSYMLVCVSNSPIVVLGGIMQVRRVSDGAT